MLQHEWNLKTDDEPSTLSSRMRRISQWDGNSLDTLHESVKVALLLKLTPEQVPQALQPERRTPDAAARSVLGLAN